MRNIRYSFLAALGLLAPGAWGCGGTESGQQADESDEAAAKSSSSSSPT